MSSAAAMKTIGKALGILLVAIVALFALFCMAKLQMDCQASGGVLIEQPLGYACTKNVIAIGKVR